MAKDPYHEQPLPCKLCGEVHAKGTDCAEEAVKQPVKIGAYTAQLCSYCGQKHRGGREVCQGTEDEDTPVLPGRKHRNAAIDSAPGLKDEDTPLTPGRRPRPRKQKRKSGHDDGTSHDTAAETGTDSNPELEQSDDIANGAEERPVSGYDDLSHVPVSQQITQPGPRLSAPDQSDSGFPSTVQAQLGSIEEPNAETLVGQTLSNKYALLELIGKGGMSAVYRAKDLKLNKTVAVKVLLPHLMASELSLQRFQVEAQAASSLYHPNLIITHDFGMTNDGRPYLVMELLEGMSLAELLRLEKRFDVETALPILIQICDALQHAHARGILHRDLKPSNVMITTTSSGMDMVRLLDFGIAKVLPQEGMESMGLTRTGEIFGSPNYMSPEQCSGSKVTPRSDIYSMGCLMYEVLAGVPPLVGENIMETLLKQMNEPAPDFKTVDPALNVPKQIQLIIFKALAKNPLDRHESAAQLGEELRAVQQNATVFFLHHIQNSWQMFRFKLRPLKPREKKLVAIISLCTILLTLAMWKLMMPYIEIKIPTTLGADKTFMPIGARPPVTMPQESLMMRTLKFQEEMLKENPHSEAYEKYRNDVTNIADQYKRAGHFKEAIVCYRNLVALCQKNDGAQAEVTRIYAAELADCLFRLSQYKEAAEIYASLHEANRIAGHTTGTATVQLVLKEATCHYALAQYRDAIPVLQKGLRMLEQYGRQEPNFVDDYAITCARLGECYRLRSLFKDASKNYENSAEAYGDLIQRGSNSPSVETRRALVNFYHAFCIYKQDKLESAEKAYKQSLPELRRLPGSSQDLYINALLQLSDIQWRRGSYFDAIGTRMKAKDLQKLLSE